MHSMTLCFRIICIIRGWESTESCNIIVLAVEESDHFSRDNFRLWESFRPGGYLEELSSNSYTICSSWRISAIGNLWPLIFEVISNILSILKDMDLWTNKGSDSSITGDGCIDVRANVYHGFNYCIFRASGRMHFQTSERVSLVSLDLLLFSEEKSVVPSLRCHIRGILRNSLQDLMKKLIHLLHTPFDLLSGLLISWDFLWLIHTNDWISVLVLDLSFSLAHSHPFYLSCLLVVFRDLLESLLRFHHEARVILQWERIELHLRRPSDWFR